MPISFLFLGFKYNKSEAKKTVWKKTKKIKKGVSLYEGKHYTKNNYNLLKYIKLTQFIVH